MKYSKWSKEFNLKDDIPMLVYLEHDDLDAILHYLVWPDDFGTVDLTMKGKAETMEDIYEGMNLERAQAVFNIQMREILSVLDDDEDQPGG